MELCNLTHPPDVDNVNSNVGSGGAPVLRVYSLEPVTREPVVIYGDKIRP